MFPVDEVVSRIQRAEELGFDSAWVMDHAFIETPRGRISGHDPVVILARAAAHTRRIRLGTLVLCTPLRSAVQIAREATALADASAGRFVLGLGAGWHRPELDAFGCPADHLVGRFEERARAIRDLLGGGPVSTDGVYERLADAQVVATAPAPPIWIAGSGPRMLRITAELAQGWNLGWGPPEPSWLAEPLARLERELARQGRDRSTFTASAGIAVVPDRASRRLVDGLRAFEDLGVDEAVLCLAEGPIQHTEPAYLERVAEVLSKV